MIIDSVVCSKPQNINLNGFEIDYVQIEWYEVSKKILHKLSKNGVDVGIKLDRNVPLKHGDILWIEGNKALVIDIPECECIALEPQTTIMMGKACYEIGNRHTPLFYQEDTLLMPYDEPLLQALKKCGFSAYKKLARLISPLGGEVIHGHSHEHTHEHGHSH
ncbi:MAG: urease accessory protein UreE [Ruminiclostridium sp.]